MHSTLAFAAGILPVLLSPASPSYVTQLLLGQDSTLLWQLT
jgi:hypothetical protein